MERFYKKSLCENAPEFLYHYTSLGKLALILQSKKIRFSELAALNDLDEQKVRFSEQDTGLTKAYVSCWTEEEQESIPMWKMYTDLTSGIRICLPKKPFEDSFSFVSLKDGSLQITSLSEVKRVEIVGNLQEANADFLTINNSLTRIEYSDDISTRDIIASEARCDFRIKFPLALGRLKRTAWEFEKEWRYIAILMTDGKNRAIPSYCDFGLREDVFKSIKILKSPMFSKENEVLLESLIEKFQIDPKQIKQSTLTGSVKL